MTIRKKSLFANQSAVLLLLLSIVLNAPLLHGAPSVTFSGTVSDPAGGRVAGAVLKLYSMTAFVASTGSGTDGTFSFTGLPSGNYLLECLHQGFRVESFPVTIGEGKMTPIELHLQLAGVNQEVTVVASSVPEPLAASPKAVTVIGPQELADRDTVFLTDALTSSPAVQIQQLGGPGMLASYRFRGMRPEDTAILLDGFPIFDASDNKNSARPFLSDLLVTNADHIEVLRGAGSSLYGSNAIGGLVNIVSPEANRDLEGHLSLEGGSLGLLQTTAGVEGRLAHHNFAYGMDLSHVNYLGDEIGFGGDVPDFYRDTSGSVRTTFDLNSRARVFLRFLVSDSFAYISEDPSPTANLPALAPGQSEYDAIAYPHAGFNFYPQIVDPDDHQANRLYEGAARVDYQHSDSWIHTAGFQALRSRRDYDDGPAVSLLDAALGYTEPAGITRQQYQGGLDELFWRSTWQVRKDTSLHADFDWQHTDFDQSSFGQNIHAAQQQFSIRVLGQTWLLDRLHLEVAGGGEFYHLSTPTFSDSTGNPYASVSGISVPSTYNADAALAYFPLRRSGAKLRVHAGTGFRTPSLYERFGSSGGGSYYGDPRLSPEHANFIEAGMDQPLLNHKLQLSGTYFFTHLQTIINFGVTPADPFGRFFGYLNTPGGNAQGVELSVTARPNSRVDLSASYTYTNSDRPAGIGLSDHQFTAGINVRPVRRLNVQWQTYGVSSYSFPLFGSAFPFPSGTFQFPGYVLASVTGSYLLLEGEHKNLHFIVRGDNVLNREYYNAGFIEPKATARTGLRLEW